MAFDYTVIKYGYEFYMCWHADELKKLFKDNLLFVKTSSEHTLFFVNRRFKDGIVCKYLRNMSKEEFDSLSEAIQDGIVLRGKWNGKNFKDYLSSNHGGDPTSIRTSSMTIMIGPCQKKIKIVHFDDLEHG